MYCHSGNYIFISNIVYSLIACILLMVLDNTLIVDYISICYLSLFLTITGITILILNLKKTKLISL